MGPTVVGALMAAGYTISTSGPAERAGVVHRLDAGTSGLMIIAKTESAYLKLKEMFREHHVEKTYHALVQGHMDPSTGTIDAPIDRHPKEDRRFAVVATGKESITHYEVIEYYRSVSLVKVELEDWSYSPNSRALLRTWPSARGRYDIRGRSRPGQEVEDVSTLASCLELRFNHPTNGTPLVLSAPYPADLQALWRCYPKRFCLRR
jgi:23S rRNA pseudouridine1911/1915/1917 synthase